MQAAPFFDDVAHGPAGGQAYWLTASDGVRLRIGHWPLPDAGTGKGTVFFFCGRTEYVEKYGPAAQEFQARGFGMLAVDWRGQGLADRACDDRLRGHVGDFSEFQLDVDAVMAAAEALAMPKPWFVIGHSMGGAIGLRALHRGLPFAAAGFSAPMWGIGMSGAQRTFAAIVGAMIPLIGATRPTPGMARAPYPLHAPFEDNTLTRDRKMWDLMRAQMQSYPDLQLGGPTVGWLHAALTECRALMGLEAPATPALTFLGANERIVDLPPVHELMGRWENGTLVVMPGSQHEIPEEEPETRQRFFDEISSFFEAIG